MRFLGGSAATYTPVLDQVNALMSAVEGSGSEPSGVILGARQAAALNSEIKVWRSGHPLDRLGVSIRAIWGVPCLYVDVPDRIAIVVDDA